MPRHVARSTGRRPVLRPVRRAAGRDRRGRPRRRGRARTPNRRSADRDRPLRRPRRLRPARRRARSRGRPAPGSTRRSGAMADGDRAFDGTREKFIGDAVFAVFGWPRGHDDDASARARCALAIREAVGHETGADGRRAAGGPYRHRDRRGRRRIPLATTRSTWSLTGEAVTTAARIQSLARPGEILLDEATVRAARKRPGVEDAGPRRAARPDPAHPRLPAPRRGDVPAVARRRSGPVVGREAERRRLRAVVDGLAAGRGSTIVVDGEAGMGKSRLMSDLADEARAAGFAGDVGRQRLVRLAASRTASGGLFAQAVADEHGTDSGTMTRRLLFTADVPAERAQRWAGAIAAIARDASVLRLGGGGAARPDRSGRGRRGDPRARRPVRGPPHRGLRSAPDHRRRPPLAGSVERRHGRRDRQRRRRAAARDRVRHSARPDGRRRDARRRSSASASSVSASPRPGSSRRSSPAPSWARPTARRLHQRTAGNPLFISETVRAIFGPGAAGVGVGPAATASPVDGRLPDDGGTVRPGLPMTLRALLGARIDALGEEARTVLRVASVIGMLFEEPFVAEVLGEQVDPEIYARLTDASLIAPIEAASTWRFAHPLDPRRRVLRACSAAPGGGSTPGSRTSSRRSRAGPRSASWLATAPRPATTSGRSRCSSMRRRRRRRLALPPRRRRSGRRRRTWSGPVRRPRRTVSWLGRPSRRRPPARPTSLPSSFA